MQAFLAPTFPSLRTSSIPRPHRTQASQAPSCSLAGRLAALAAAFTLTLTDAALPRAHAGAAVVAAPQEAVVRTVYARSNHAAAPLAVVGVGKARIHDYSIAPQQQAQQQQAYGYATQTGMSELDDEALREFSLAARLVTAVLLGVMLGVERRATTYNLGIRSITLISLCTALVSSLMTGPESGYYMPLITQSPHISVVALATSIGMAAYAAARLRQRRTRHRAEMCWTIGLGVAMGGACGAGLSLLSVVCYLAAVAVLRGDKGRVERRPVRDSSVVRDGLREFEPMIKVGDGIDGKGFST